MVGEERGRAGGQQKGAGGFDASSKARARAQGERLACGVCNHLSKLEIARNIYQRIDCSLLQAGARGAVPGYHMLGLAE